MSARTWGFKSPLAHDQVWGAPRASSNTGSPATPGLQVAVATVGNLPEGTRDLRIPVYLQTFGWVSSPVLQLVRDAECTHSDSAARTYAVGW